MATSSKATQAIIKEYLSHTPSVSQEARLQTLVLLLVQHSQARLMTRTSARRLRMGCKFFLSVLQYSGSGHIIPFNHSFDFNAHSAHLIPPKSTILDLFFS
jgi:hypothetical protein